MITTSSWLTTNRDETLKNVVEGFGKTMKELKDDVKTMREWLRTQPHLPEISSENHIINTLLMNKLSVENSKHRLDMYYTMRSLLPEIYENRHSKEMKKMADIIYFFPLPKRTPEGHRVHVIKLADSNTEIFDFYALLGYCYNSFEMRIQEDVFSNEIYINDLKNLRLGHIPKITPVHLKKMILVLEKVYNNRVKEFHLLNCPSYAINLVNILKSLLKPKLAARLFVHEEVSNIGKFIALESLPRDYGGCELPLHELNEIWKKKLTEYGNRFEKLAKMKTNEKLRPTPLVNDEILGFHGHFRKLEMD